MSTGFDRLAAALVEIDRMRAASAARDAKLRAELTETAAAMGAHVEPTCSCGYAEMSRYERNTHECACEPTIEELIEAITNEVVAQHNLRVKLLEAEARIDVLEMATVTRCPRNHEALKRSPLLWRALDYVGTQRVTADEYGSAEAIELRNCTCGSTLAIRIERADDFAAEDAA